MPDRLLLLADAGSTHTQRWATEFARRGYDVHVASLRDRAIPGVTVHPLRPAKAGKLGYLAALPTVRRLIRDLCPALVHAHYATSYGLLGALSGFHPFVVSVWGSDVYDFPARSPFHRALFAHNLRKADAITSTSRDMARLAGRYVPGRDIEVIPFGVPLAQYPLVTPTGEPTIGCIKALEPWYGQEYLIRAIALLKAPAAREARLLLVGRGSDGERLAALAREQGVANRIEFVGEIPAGGIPDFMRRLTLLAMPSLSESFGVVAVEASACGLPVIASRVGGVPEVVRDGETGLLVEPRNVEGLARALDSLLSDPALCERLGRAGREHVERHYEWARNVDQMEAVYCRLGVTRPH
jgi:glycosyltransferase involved in cell wall biosynthesis